MLQLRLPALLVATLLAACSPPPVTMSAGGKGSDNGGGGGSTGSRKDGGSAPAPLPDASSADRPACEPATCTVAGGKYCGKIGDGCGGTLECGDCPMGDTCGGGGTPQVCGRPPDPSCKPITCQQIGGRLCGRVGDGCGGSLECGDCPGGTRCGTTMANVCGDGVAACENLCKQQMKCANGGDTTVTGTVFAPTPPRFGAADPLYNAVVYVPNGTVQPFAPGVSCEQCGKISGSPLVTALSGPDGKFTLKNVPVGTDIPLVIQIGRWRRQVKIPQVTACQDTALPAELTRLPRTQAEGDIPLMAIATGTWDPFDCTLRKIGVDEAEFTVPTGKGRVHVYAYGGNVLREKTPPGGNLVGSLDTLNKYDMVLLPCDDESDKLRMEQQNLLSYAGKGGRIFLTDWGYTWLRDMGDFQGTVVWKNRAVLQGEDYTPLIDQTFPKGMAFAQWLRAVGAIGAMAQGLRVHDPFSGASNVDAVVAPTQRWLYTEGTTRKSIQHLTFNTPIGADANAQCGRVVFSQFHVAETDGGGIIFPDLSIFPMSCDDKPMTPQEKALEFMLFDASACVMPDSEPPRVFQPPPLAPPPAPPPIL